MGGGAVRTDKRVDAVAQRPACTDEVAGRLARRATEEVIGGDPAEVSGVKCESDGIAFQLPGDGLFGHLCFLGQCNTYRLFSDDGGYRVTIHHRVYTRIEASGCGSNSSDNFVDTYEDLGRVDTERPPRDMGNDEEPETEREPGPDMPEIRPDMGTDMPVRPPDMGVDLPPDIGSDGPIVPPTDMPADLPDGGVPDLPRDAGVPHPDLGPDIGPDHGADAGSPGECVGSDVLNCAWATVTGTPRDIDVLSGAAQLVYISEGSVQNELGICPVGVSIGSVTCNTVTLPKTTGDGQPITLLSHAEDPGSSRSVVTFRGLDDENLFGWFTVDRAGRAIIDEDSYRDLMGGSAGRTYTHHLTLSPGSLIFNGMLFLTIESFGYRCTTSGATDPCSCGCVESPFGAVIQFDRCADGTFDLDCGGGSEDDLFPMEQIWATSGRGTSGIRQIGGSNNALVVNAESPSSVDRLDLSDLSRIDIIGATTPIGSFSLIQTPEAQFSNGGVRVFLGRDTGARELLVKDFGGTLRRTTLGLEHVIGVAADTNDGNVAIVTDPGGGVERYSIDASGRGSLSGATLIYRGADASEMDPARNIHYQGVPGRIIATRY